MRAFDLTGKKFGRWTVIKRAASKEGASFWECVCNCGNKNSVSGRALVYGTSKSCGCWAIELATKHGHNPTANPSATYRVWRGIKARCNNPNVKIFKRYGGRGIKMCDRWKKSFANFLADMGERPAGLSIERKNNNGHYTPKNCKWATRTEQARNRRSSRFLIYKGERKTLAEWCELLNLSYANVSARLKLGWSVKEAFEMPVNRGIKRKI